MPPPPVPPAPSGDQSGAFQGIIDAIATGFKGDSANVITAVGSEAYLQASALFDRHEEMIHDFGANSKTFKNMYAGVTEMQQSFYGMSAENGDALSTIFNNQGELIKEYQGIVGSNLLQIHATSERVTAKEMADLTLYGRALSYTTKQSQAFLERQFALTGEVNDDLLKQSLAYSKAIEESTGISSKIIAGNISGMMSDVRTFGNMTVEEMSEAAAAIAKVGLEVTDVAGLVKAFSSFEGAADSVSKLTQVFGVQMDTMKYMTASFESPEEMLAMIQEDFETAGVDMANMNMAQKRLLSDTLGMDISSVESLLGEAGSGLSQFTNQVSGATAGVGATEIDGALAGASNDIAKLNQMGTSVADAVEKAAERANKAVASIFSEGIRQVADEAGSFTDQGIRILNKASMGVAAAGAAAVGLSGPGGAQERIVGAINGGTGRVRNYADTWSPESDPEGTPFGESVPEGSYARGVVREQPNSSPATPAVLSSDQASTVGEILESAPVDSTQYAPVEVINLDPGMSHEQIVAFTNEFNNATNNSMQQAQRDEMIAYITAAIESRPNEEIVVRLEDSESGLLAYLQGQGVITVERR